MEQLKGEQSYSRATSSFFRNKTPKDIRWSKLNYKAGEKSILTDCWGSVPAGQVCAIMGPSGAGKSSLLNVLAGRSSPGAGISIEGMVTVGGKIINPVAYRKNIAYVMQDDALLATATPREALRFSAMMRLPASTPMEQINELVEGLLVDLGIDECADVLIGGPLIKGISGGQRKRTSVGVELIVDPALLFLDEPTTGLDSYSAYNLVSLLKNVAAANCAILCTIHQPSSEVFFLFDNVIFMKDGYIFYQGPVTDIVAYYSKFGEVCPDDYNPADFVMNLCQSDSLEALQGRNLLMGTPQEFSEHVQSERLVSEHNDFYVESSLIKQIAQLTGREFINFYRDTGALIARFAITIILGILYGLIFLGACGKDNGDNTNFNNHVGAVAMITIFCLFGPAQGVLLNFPFERPLFLREYSTGTYTAKAYFLSKLVIEIPLCFIQILVLYILEYFMMDMQGNFIFLVLASWAIAMVSNSVAYCLGCLVPDVKDATELAPLVYVPQILFAGFFIRTSQIPVFLRWAQYLCSMKYGINLIYFTEFDVSLSTCNGSENAKENCRSILSNNGASTDTFYINIILLFVLFIAFRLLAGIILVQKAKKFY